nr:hypothetical protein CFP56_38551 [Quercus suber]
MDEMGITCITAITACLTGFSWSGLAANKHLVQYEDDEEELLDLEKEKFEWVQDTLKKFKWFCQSALDSSEAVEIAEEEMDVKGIKPDEEEDVVKGSKWKGGEKGRLKKRKASEGEKLGSAKKNKEGFNFP